MANEHGTDVGWLNVYGDGQAVFHALAIRTDNWIIDGSKRDAKNSGHGFKVVVPGDKGADTAEHGSWSLGAYEYVDSNPPGAGSNSGGSGSGGGCFLATTMANWADIDVARKNNLGIK